MQNKNVSRERSFKQTLQFLEEHGIFYSEITLRRAIKAGYGPKFHRIRPHAPMFFKESDLLTWIDNRGEK